MVSGCQSRVPTTICHCEERPLILSSSRDVAISMRLNTRRRTAVATTPGLPRYARNDKVGTQEVAVIVYNGRPTNETRWIRTFPVNDLQRILAVTRSFAWASASLGVYSWVNKQTASPSRRSFSSSWGSSSPYGPFHCRFRRTAVWYLAYRSYKRGDATAD